MCGKTGMWGCLRLSPTRYTYRMAMGLKETAAANSEGSMPKWQKDLGLKAGHSVIPKLAAISDFFAGLSLPLQALPRAEADETVRRFRQRDDSQPHKPDFEYDKDYFFGRNEGEPDSVRLNAQAAWYEERQGVELWRILKSVAFVTPNKNLVLVHLRGDRDVNKTALAEMLGFQETDLGQANLEELGVEYGTVSPFIRNANVPIRHVFDRDLVDGKDYPRDDIVFASPGDKRFYVGFEVRKYLKAETQTSGVIERANISLQSQDSPRIVARRRIAIIGGDSSIDTSNLKSLVATTITDSLQEKELYYGDRSLPDIDDISTRRLSGSINAALHGPQLRSVAREIASEIQEKTPQEQFLPRGQDSRIITTFSSMAMHTTAGKELRKMEGIEYVGPQEAVNNELLELKKRGVDVTHTILVGLSAAHDRNDSAFGQDILDTTLPVDDG